MNKQIHSTESVQWDITTDVLVVGTGFAGLSAAIEAKKSRAEVVVIEKMKGFGGNSIISDGGIAAPGTEYQLTRGINDSTDEMYADMIKAGLGLNNPNLLRTVVNQAKDAFEWTIEELGVPYMDRVDIFGGHSVPRCYTPENKTGATILKKMVQSLDKLEVPIKYGVSFRYFYTNASGKVIGAKLFENYDYKNDTGKAINVQVNKGIILATGGFGADVGFRSIQDPRLSKEIMTTNKPFATAEALKEALHLGAASVHLSQIQLGAWASPDEAGFGDGPLFSDYVLFQYGMIIDPHTGKRFVNELGDRKISADAILSIGHPCIGIADEKSVKMAGWDLSKAIKKGVIKLFNNVEDIANHYSIDAKELQNSIEKYNGFVENGKDTDFGKLIVENATTIDSAPYYVMRLWPKVHYTMGGIKINEKAQVVDFEGQIIPNLYAAGEVVGGVHGASRLGSCAVTECIVFGRIAGKEVCNGYSSHKNHQ